MLGFGYKQVGTAVHAPNVSIDGQEESLAQHSDIAFGVVVRMPSFSALYLPEKPALNHGRGMEPQLKATYKPKK